MTVCTGATAEGASIGAAVVGASSWIGVLAIFVFPKDALLDVSMVENRFLIVPNNPNFVFFGWSPLTADVVGCNSVPAGIDTFLLSPEARGIVVEGCDFPILGEEDELTAVLEVPVDAVEGATIGAGAGTGIGATAGPFVPVAG